MLPYARIWLPAAVLLFALASCDFFGSDEADGGYYLYVGNWGEDEIFVVDAGTNEVVRTLKGFDSVWTLAVSQDGRMLYVGTQRVTYERDSDGRIIPGGSVFMTGALYAVDVRRWSKKKLLDKPVDKVFAGPPELVAFVEHTFGKSGQPVGLVDTRTNVVTFLDTLDIVEEGTVGLDRQGLVFHPWRPLFYSVDNQERLFAYDYERKEVVRTYGSTGGIFINNMAISPEGQKMYVAGGPVLDLEQDAIVGWVGGNRLGSLALSPAGDTLYVTDPGKYLIPEPVAAGKVFLYDTSSYRYVGEIDVTAASPYPGTGDLTDTIVLSPDGRTAYVSNWTDLVFVIDLTTKQVTELIQPREKNIHTVPLTLGPKP